MDSTSETEPESDSETGLLALLDARTAAIRDRDLDRLMALYSEGVTSYDLVPPLVYETRDALRAVFATWLSGYRDTIGMEVRGVTIERQGTLGVVHWLNRTSGTLVDSREVAYWARATMVCVLRDGRWTITHEHLSLPVDFRSGAAAMDLEPRSV